MPQPATPPDDARTFPAVCGHTHLFPGVRCLLQGLPDPRAFAAEPWPIGVDLTFSDGTLVDADLRTDDPARPVLVVPAHTTGAGTHVDDRAWPVKECVRSGDEVALTLGTRTSD